MTDALEGDPVNERRLRGRPLAGPAEFAAVQELVRRGWREHGPLGYSSPGALDWWRVLDPVAEPATRILLWTDTDAGRVAGWSWSRGGDVEWFVDPSLSAADERSIRAAMLEWHAAARATEPWAVYAAGPLEEAVARDGGGSPAAGHALVQLRRDLSLGVPASVAPPAGYRIRPVRAAGEHEARVAVHRAAFAPSRLTLEMYSALVAPGSAYDPELDLVASSPDGTLAGFAIGWLDAEASVGEVEPLGVHPDHRGRGLAAALASALLAAFATGGARWAIVYCDEANTAALAAYRRAGFEPASRAVRYEGTRAGRDAPAGTPEPVAG